MLERLGDAVAEVLARFRGDERIPRGLPGEMAQAWEAGLAVAKEAGKLSRGLARPR